ncbi:MAG: hypothetical protein ACRCYY_03285 [Trueperaceae bacterium]
MKNDVSVNFPFPYTSEQILGLAQHDHQVKISRELAAAHKWQNLSKDDQGIWAEIPVKDKLPIQTKVCLESLSFSCSCVSYHHPCQHGLGLLLLWLEQPESFTKQETPQHITWTLTEPSEISETDEFSEMVDTPQRYKRIDTGLHELELWLFDLLRLGLEVARGRPTTYYQQMADRLVDAELSELAKDIRQLTTFTAKNPRWHEDYLGVLGRLHLLIQGFKRLETLSDITKADIHAALGISPELEHTSIIDNWHVLGRRVETEPNRKVQRVYVWGETSQRPAVLVNVLHDKKTVVTRFLPGVVLRASLSFYKNSMPLRAELVSFENISQSKTKLPGETSIKFALESFAAIKTQNPWLRTYPLVLQDVVVEQHERAWILRDKEGYFIPLPPRHQHAWYLRALSAEGLWIFGDFDGVRFSPMSTWAQHRLLELHTLKGIT